MRPLAIIQARYGASRLKGKVLLDLEGSPLLAHVIRRVKASSVAKVVLACPDSPENDAVAAVGEAEGVDVYRGSESDVLARYYWAAQAYPDLDPIVRITGEDALKDPKLIDYTLLFWESGHRLSNGVWLDEFDYAHLGGNTWPLGCDVEVFSRDALTYSHQYAIREEEREHVTLHMAKNMVAAQIRNPTPVPGYDSRRRWTVDTEDDYRHVRALYREFYAGNPLFGYYDVVKAGL